ncbi:hypothetical protein DRE_07279 [Drechslerella stenobrocha 248]|uniref:Tyrosinase copper-binding domain-containing protein n=1 Tax=Drechslerella stenobrocha 248 TaxID=1043628 RepID=W7I510_9PEZI|nr:hypothetical protein DRE_07279 [Drechslerella stenobrocha 248]
MAVLSVAGRRLMSFVSALLLVGAVSTVLAAPAAPPPAGNIFAPPGRKSVVRKEWRTLPRQERIDFLNAMKCLLTKSAFTPQSLVPGAVSRYDDVVSTHQDQTFSIHYVGHFIPWHRYATWTVETMLQTECGYSKGMPYWDWDLDVGKGNQKFFDSPLWDTDEAGFGGNGDFIPMAEGGFPPVPGRTGGGCVNGGAFQNMSVNLGPADSKALNSRCLTRDFSPYFAGRYLQKNETARALTATNFYVFDDLVEGGPSYDASGIHGGGHYGIGGNLGTMGDLYLSPGDPSFWLHHANLDRVWWSWQLANSDYFCDMSGPSLLMNKASPNVTLAQRIHMGWADKVQINTGVSVGQIMNIEKMMYSYDNIYNLDASQRPTASNEHPTRVCPSS